jgi:hypothetical protein
MEKSKEPSYRSTEIMGAMVTIDYKNSITRSSKARQAFDIRHGSSTTTRANTEHSALKSIWVIREKLIE